MSVKIYKNPKKGAKGRKCKVNIVRRLIHENIHGLNSREMGLYTHRGLIGVQDTDGD